MSIKTKQRALALASRLVIAAVVGASTVACSSFLTQLKQNPVQVAESLASYVQTFLGIAQAVWGFIAPNVSAAANQTFASAVSTVQHASLAAQDAAQAYQGGDAGSVVDAVAQVKDAVANLEGIVAQYQGSAPAGALAAGKLDDLQHAGAKIAAWQ